MDNPFVRTELNKVYNSHKYIETENTDLDQHYITCEQRSLLLVGKGSRMFLNATLWPSINVVDCILMLDGYNIFLFELEISFLIILPY